MRLLLAAVFWLLAASTAQAQATAPAHSQLETLGLAAYTYEQLSVTATATVLSSKVNDDNVLAVAVTPIDGDIIITRNGQAPTSSYGLRIFRYGVAILSTTEARLFQAIRAGTSNVTTNVEYYAPVGTTGIP